MSVAHEIFVWFGSVLPTQDFFFSTRYFDFNQMR